VELATAAGVQVTGNISGTRRGNYARFPKSDAAVPAAICYPDLRPPSRLAAVKERKMKFVENLVGGTLVILVAGVIAVLQNAVRDDRIPLIPKITASRVGKPEAPVSSTVNPAPALAGSRESDAHVGEGTPGLPTEDEFARGEISRERVKGLIEGGRIVLIDARASQEYAAGHIAGAISIPYEEFADHYDELKQKVSLDAMIVCYCQSVTCDDSENLARELKFMGYRNVILYKGGWDEWSQAGYPTESSASGE
jgi:rhodanese-related sulfurtransferase